MSANTASRLPGAVRFSYCSRPRWEGGWGGGGGRHQASMQHKQRLPKHGHMLKQCTPSEAPAHLNHVQLLSREGVQPPSNSQAVVKPPACKWVSDILARNRPHVSVVAPACLAWRINQKCALYWPNFQRHSLLLLVPSLIRRQSAMEVPVLPRRRRSKHSSAGSGTHQSGHVPTNWAMISATK